MKSGLLVQLLPLFAALSIAQTPTTTSPAETSVYPGLPPCAVYSPNLLLTTCHDSLELIFCLIDLDSMYPWSGISCRMLSSQPDLCLPDFTIPRRDSVV